MRQTKLFTFFILLLTVASTVSAGELKFSRHYTDNMVLQREKLILIRGLADNGAAVTVTFSGQSKEAKADDGGKWSVTLDPMPASAEGKILTVSSSSMDLSAEIKNVLVGDVFFFARQTTIDVDLGRTAEGRAAAVDVPSVRVISIKTIPAAEPQQELAREATNGWTILDKNAALKMDAAAFYFAKGLEGNEAPIGIIEVDLGRHFPIGWMSKEALLETPNVFGKKGEEVVRVIQKMEEAKKEFENPSEKTLFRDTKRGYPRSPAELDARYPAAGYNAVLHPLRGLAVKALLLQLGNNYPYYPYANLERDGKDTSRAHAAQAFDDSYTVRKWGLYLAPTTTPRLPQEWRKALGDPNLPVGWIAPPGSDLDTLARHHREMRELQRRAAEEETGVDLILPGADSVFLSAQPADDALLGSRCLAWVQGAVYQQDGVAPTGPVFDRVELNGAAARVFFKPGTAKGLKAGKGVLELFEVAAANINDNPNIAPNQNLEYVQARATIDGETIHLSSDTVQEIAYVRYNWKEKPEQGLVIASGLPATPFSTDGVAFPRRISSSGEEILPPEFFMSIADRNDEGPVIYDGKLQTIPSAGEAMGPTGILGTVAYRRNLFVNNTYAGSPADGKILHGDFIYGVNGKPFGKDLTADLAEAITLAETAEAKGVLSLNVLRNDKKIAVELQLPVLGTFSETSPYDCPKTERMVAEAEAHLAEAHLAEAGGPKGGGGRMTHPVFTNPEAMFLLAAGTPMYQGLVRRHVYKRLAARDLGIPISPVGRANTGGPWDTSADMLLVSEYYLATGDKNVLPYLKHMCDALTSIQIRHPDEKAPCHQTTKPH